MQFRKRGHLLDFELPIHGLEDEIERLEQQAQHGQHPRRKLATLQEHLAAIRADIYANLTPTQRVAVARHPNRPTALDYIKALGPDFMELHGDRQGSDDPAIVGGLIKVGDRSVVALGHQKGHDTRTNIERNFGMPQPAGFRKALRLMNHAAKFGLPVVTFIDSPGAYPGKEAEEEGQGEAIARNLMGMAGLKVPIVCVITGEGASGGALAIGVGDRILMLEYAFYSVISPEGCAAILWRDGSRAPDAAAALRISAAELQGLGVVDEIIPEPPGAAHHAPEETVARVRDAIIRQLDTLTDLPTSQLLDGRYAKYRAMGQIAEAHA